MVRAVCVVLIGVLVLTQMASAQTGGSFGGGFGQNPSPPAPGGGAPGIGNPLDFLPYVYWFGGSFAGIILIVLIAAFLIWTWYRRSSAAKSLLGQTGPSGAAALKVQVMMLHGEAVKRELHDIAANGQTGTPHGLSAMIRDAAVSVMRHPERWVYANVEIEHGSPTTSGQRVSGWSSLARSAFKLETIRNAGQVRTIAQAGVPGGTYCIVTFAVAAREFMLPLVTPPIEISEVQSALTAVAGLTADNLIAAEVIWSPDAPGELLTEDQALRLYPSLYHL